MDKQARETYLKDNYGKTSIGMAAHATGLTKETVRRKWLTMKLSKDFVPGKPMEPEYEGTYVYIPQLKARVKLKPGQTAEQYIAKTNTHGMMTVYHSGAAKNRDGAWSSQK